MNKIAVIGGGAWGCALASAILKKGYYPFILTSSTKRAEQINNEFLSRFKNLLFLNLITTVANATIKIAPEI